MNALKFSLISIGVGLLVLAFAHWLGLDYFYFAGYTILQFIVLATAWNILGGYCGYVNFGTAAFFALGAYSSVFMYKFYPLPIPVLILISAVVSGIVGFGMGYLTLRLRGSFFAIATLAMAVVLQTLVINWDYVGGSRGAYILRPEKMEIAGLTINYIEYLFVLMLILAVVALATARTIERSQLGFGFATIRDDEMAAEACGVPTLRLKLIATTLSGAFMGMAGAPFPYYIGYIQPQSAFGLGVRGQFDRHADDRRHHQLDRAAGRLYPARLRPAICHGDDLLGGQPADRRLDAGGLRHHRAQRPDRACAETPAPRAAMTALLHVDNISKRFGGFVALDGIDLEVQPGERLGLIGPNGSGKSTLVNCICGTLQNESGSVRFDGQVMDGLAAHQRTHRGIARSFQLPRPFHSMNLADNLRIPLLYTVHARLGPLRSPGDLDTRCGELLEMVGLEKKAKQMPRDLTQVEMRKLELARAMAAEPKLLIADELMAGLSHSEIEDILTLLVRLNERGITIILIEHIMTAVMSFSQRLAVLVSGRKIADGKPEDVVRDEQVVRAYIGQ